MTASYMSTEGPKEPAQTVCPVQPPGHVASTPDSVPVEELIGDRDTLLNGHSNLFVPATADPDQQVITLHTSNGTFQQVEHNGEANSDGADESANHTQSWQVFSHTISVKTGFPDSESGSQHNGYHDEVSFDALELEEVTLKLPVVKGQVLAQPATDEQFEVMRYAEWLAAEAKRNNNGSHQEESNKYAEDALKTVTL